MTEYVLVLPIQWRGEFSDNIIFVLKDKPSWQKNRLNLIGGKVEPGETPEQAAVRELKEETGFTVVSDCFAEWGCPQICGKIVGSDHIVHCVNCYINEPMGTMPTPREGETEELYWHQFWRVNHDPRLLPNLKMIIPMMLLDVKGWTITSPEDSSLSDAEFKISFDSVN